MKRLLMLLILAGAAHAQNVHKGAPGPVGPKPALVTVPDGNTSCWVGEDGRAHCQGPDGKMEDAPCPLTDMMLNLDHGHAPGPMDVPAVKQWCWCGGPNPDDMNDGVVRCGPPPKHPIEHNGSCRGPASEGWSCADKRRILLTAEDGSKHCILFPKEPK